MKKVFWSIFIVFPMLSFGQSSTSVEVTPALVSELLQRARTNNPGLAAASARVEAAKQNAQGVRIWHDPVVALSKTAASRQMMREDGDVILSVDQPLPLFGKEKLQRKVAEANTEVERANSSYRDYVLRRDLTSALLRSALMEREVKIAEDDLAWVDLITDTARKRYALGTSAQTDVLRLETERAKRFNDLRSSTNNLTRERLVINKLLNLPLDASLPRFDLPRLADETPPAGAIISFAQKADPKTKVMRQQIKEAEAMTKLTRRQKRPDIFVGAEANRYSGDGSFTQGMLKIGMNFPWFNGSKYERDIKRDEARLRATELDLADYQLELRDEIIRLTTALDNSRRNALVTTDQIIPRAEQSLSSSVANWSSGRGNFIDVLDTRRTLLDARLSLTRAIAEQHEALSELLLLLGTEDLSSLSQTSTPTSTNSQP